MNLKFVSPLLILLLLIGCAPFSSQEGIKEFHLNFIKGDTLLLREAKESGYYDSINNSTREDSIQYY